MIIDGLHPELALEFVECRGRHAFEHRIGITLHLHAIHHLIAFVEVVHHLFDGVDIVLKVHVHCYQCVAMVGRLHHAGHDGVLMPDIAREVKPFDALVLAMEPGDYLPAFVAATVVHNQHIAVSRDFPFGHEAVEQRLQHSGRTVEHSFFIITGAYNGKTCHFITIIIYDSLIRAKSKLLCI